MSNQCPSMKLIQQQQSEMVRSAFSSAPIPVNHRSTPIPITYASKTSFADVLEQSIQDHTIRNMMLSKDL